MRKARIKVRGRLAVYHCISRIVGGQFLLDDPCKERFRKQMRQQADFCGIEIITYCVMGNHYHVLLRAPEKPDVDDPTLLKRVEGFYGKESKLAQQLREGIDGKGSIDKNLRKRLLERMGDISVFNKELKQRFSRWYNRLHDRYGTLWAERFKSLLVEDETEVVKSLAAYVDLNPVRAGLVADPKEYRFCGYAEAVAGGKVARHGLLSILEGTNWKKAGPEYRVLLFVKAGRSGRSDKAIVDRKKIKRILDEGGVISQAQALRLRIRYFTDGVALGSRTFLEEVFIEFRDRFGAERTSGSRPLRKLPMKHMCTLRDLRVGATS